MAHHKFNLIPFPVIRSVGINMPPRNREEGFHPIPALQLSDISVDTLIELCDDFKNAMLAEQKDQIDKNSKLRDSLKRSVGP